MSDTVKLIIEIPKEDYKKLVNPYQHNEIWCERLKRMVIHGIPLDDVKAEIMQLDYELESFYYGHNDTVQAERVHTICREEVLQILDNIGKAESEEV